jgi:replicative DNA helicase
MSTSVKSKSLVSYVPPCDVQAEQSLLGSILLNNDILNEVVDRLRPDYFYDTKNKDVFEIMVRLWSANKMCDVISLLNEIELQSKKTGNEQSIDQDYLLELIAKSSLSIGTESTVSILKDKYLMRTLVKVGADITDLATNELESPNDVLDKAQQRLYEVSIDNVAKNFIPISEILAGAFDRISEAHNNPGESLGLPTGFIQLDKVLGGFHNSDLIILAARPSMGKTSLALEITKRVALKQNIGVAVFSLEMSKEQLVDKLLVSASGVDSWKIRTGKFDESKGNSEFIQLGEAISLLDNAPIWIDDSGSLNILELRSKARKLKTRNNVGLIIIDYLQLMSGAANKNYSNNRVQEVSEISRGLKMLAKELNIPIIALSQLSRSVEGREDKRPMLSDLRESGSIEQDADVVMFVHREEMYRKETTKKGVADIIISKHRHGETASVELAWVGRLATFDNLDLSKLSYKTNE